MTVIVDPKNLIGCLEIQNLVDLQYFECRNEIDYYTIIH